MAIYTLQPGAKFPHSSGSFVTRVAGGDSCSIPVLRSDEAYPRYLLSCIADIFRITSSVENRGFLARRELPEASSHWAVKHLHRDLDERSVSHPGAVVDACWTAFERVGVQVVKVREA